MEKQLGQTSGKMQQPQSGAQLQLRAGKPREWYEKLMREEPKPERKPEPKISVARMSGKNLKIIKKTVRNDALWEGKRPKCFQNNSLSVFHEDDLKEIAAELARHGRNRALKTICSLSQDTNIPKILPAKDSNKLELEIVRNVDGALERARLLYSQGFERTQVLRLICKARYEHFKKSKAFSRIGITGVVCGSLIGAVGGAILELKIKSGIGEEPFVLFGLVAGFFTGCAVALISSIVMIRTAHIIEEQILRHKIEKTGWIDGNDYCGVKKHE